MIYMVTSSTAYPKISYYTWVKSQIFFGICILISSGCVQEWFISKTRSMSPYFAATCSYSRHVLFTLSPHIAHIYHPQPLVRISEANNIGKGLCKSRNVLAYHCCIYTTSAPPRTSFARLSGSVVCGSIYTFRGAKRWCRTARRKVGSAIDLIIYIPSDAQQTSSVAYI